jgi:hypothetical protein
MSKTKSLMERTANAVTNAAQTVTEGLKSAGEAVADAIRPKPVRAGDKVIIPSTDPSMPPVIVPVKKRARRTGIGKARSRRVTAKSTAPRRSKRATASRKQPSTASAPRARTTRNKAAAKSRSARKSARKVADRGSGKTAPR